MLASPPPLRRSAPRGRRAVVRAQAGLTVLELLIVMAVIGLASYLAVSGFRVLTSAALVEDTYEVVAVMRRSQSLAAETGVPVRLVLDLDRHAYWVETCSGAPTLRRSNEEEKLDPEAQAKALEEAKRKIALLPAGQLKAGTPEDEQRMILAMAGDKTGGRVCTPLSASQQYKDIATGDAEARDLNRKLQTHRSVKFRQVWVQHLDESVQDGQVSINFFPLGWAEKAIIEITDGDSVHTLLLHGASGRVEVVDGKMRDPDDHMLKRDDGERDRDREEPR